MALTGFVFTRVLPIQEAVTVHQPIFDLVDYYDKLGVTGTINAAGTYTYLTGATMPPLVQAAVAETANHPVYLEDLHKAAGEYLARRLRCEPAMVSGGCKGRSFSHLDRSREWCQGLGPTLLAY
jgi:hypothetical protein